MSIGQQQSGNYGRRSVHVLIQGMVPLTAGKWTAMKNKEKSQSWES